MFTGPAWRIPVYTGDMESPLTKVVNASCIYTWGKGEPLLLTPVFDFGAPVFGGFNIVIGQSLLLFTY